jgi:hypothetical protein
LPIFDFRLPPCLYLADPEIKNQQSKIGNVLMADRPRLPPLDKREATFDKSWDILETCASDVPTGDAGHVFKYALIMPFSRLLPAVFSLRPIWHRVL